MPEVKPPISIPANDVTFEPMTKVDVGELLLATAQNAQYLSAELQEIITKFCSLQQAPKLVIRKEAKDE